MNPAAAAEVDQGTGGPKRRTGHKGRFRRYLPFFALIGLSTVIGVCNPRFFEVANLVRVANSSCIPLVLGLGSTFVIVLGSIDLSVEGILAVGAVTVSLLVQNDHNTNHLGWGGAILATLLCAGLGFINGAIHVGLRIPSFMVTLGTWFVGVGTATLILGGSTVRLLDPALRSLALNRFVNLPWAVWLALAALAITWFLERFTRFGRYVFAIGGAEDIAALSGVPIRWVKLRVFALAGALYGLGGVMAAAQLGQGKAVIGDGRLFTTVTAVVVGGTALTGGEGGVLNTVVGVLIMSVLVNGMILVGISPFLQQAVQGMLIILSVALSIDRGSLKVVK
ncbi:MAG TPA: ABC transporter permease [Chthoniobacterales bacterium]